MQVQTPPRPTAATGRIPLGELPLADFVLRSSGTNASPILKPVVANRKTNASTPRRVKRHADPATPPHSTTKPINIRPHHPHIYHSAPVSNDPASPSIHGQPQRPCTPTMDTCLAASPSAARMSGDASHSAFPQGRGRSDSASSSMSNGDRQGPAPLARKRDRVNPIEVAQARERVHRPITGSPSPRKPVESPSHTQSRLHHRRNSSTASLTGLMSGRTRTGSISESALGESSRSSSSCMLLSSGNDNDENDEAALDSCDEGADADEPMVQVSPMKLVPSPKSSTSSRRHRSSVSGSGRLFFGQSLDDIFGVNTCSSDGSLVIYQDVIEEEPSQVDAAQHSSPHVVKRRRVSQEIDEKDVLDKENFALPAQSKTRSGSSTSSSRSSSGSMSSFFRNSSSPEGEDENRNKNMDAQVQQPLTKRKGTGGRLSLLASALDSDADSSRESAV